MRKTKKKNRKEERKTVLMNNTDKRAYLKELSALAIGEAIVAIITVGVFLLLDVIFGDKSFFDFTVLTGSVLGCAVVIVNFLILSVSVNRAVEGYLSERGDKEMTDEEAEAFAREHQSRVQLAVARSYIIRTVLMIGTLVLAFRLEWFNPIATLVPLIMYKPVIYITNILKQRKGE